MAKVADINGSRPMMEGNWEDDSSSLTHRKTSSPSTSLSVERPPSYDGRDRQGDDEVELGVKDKQMEEEEKKSCKSCCVNILKQNLFIILLLLGIATGAAMGVGLRYTHPELATDPMAIMFLSFPGDIFLRMLKSCIIPLIVSSLISGMAALPTTAAGRIGGFAMVYYMITTLMAVILGIILVATIQPGNKGFDSDSVAEQKGQLTEPVDALLDLIRNAFPSNIVASCFLYTKTDYTIVKVPENVTENGTVTEVINEVIASRKINDYVNGTNVIGLVVFSVALGVVIAKLGKKGDPLKDFFQSLNDAIIQLVKAIMWLAPIGVCFLLAGRIVSMKNPANEFAQLGWYMMTVLIGLFIHGLIVLPTIYFIFTRSNPYLLLFHVGQALLTAFGTASSSATLPVTLYCIEERAHVHTLVSRFVLPVGSTINMDGTALYEAVASIFIAQVNGYTLSIGQYIAVSVTATAAAIGAAGVPEAGLVTMIIVLTALGLPYDLVGLIFAVDWLLDRFRTTVNVWGDCIGAGVVQRLCRLQLAKIDAEEKARLEGDANTSSSVGDTAVTVVPSGSTRL